MRAQDQGSGAGVTLSLQNRPALANVGNRAVLLSSIETFIEVQGEDPGVHEASTAKGRTAEVE
jgi:hypothetical protein